MADEEEQHPQPPEIILEPEKMAGVWANFASVVHTQHEFTLDFIRMEAHGAQGMVVARVSVSPLFITQLIDALGDNWQKYAAKALPKEVHESGANDPKGGDAEAGDDSPGSG